MGVVIDGLRDGLQLPPDYTVSEWADMNVRLPLEAAEPGRWRTDRAPYQREMMDVLADPDVHTVTLHTSAQVGKTAVELNGIGYYIHHSPAAMLRLDPTLEMAEAFSKDKLDPIIRSTPALAERVAGEKSRSSSNTIYHKQFPGGSLTITGANSPTSLRMRSVKIVWADEIDAYPASVGDEGDPIRLAYKRTQTFRSSGAKLVVASTPKLKGLSRIDSFFEQSDKRYYFIPCAECAEFQKLVWDNVLWDRGKPETAAYACPHCGSLMTDAAIKRQVKLGHWRASEPFNGHAGFHIWQIYSPWSSLEEIVKDYEEAKDRPNLLQTWWNVVLGEAWDGDEALGVEIPELMRRREPYAEDELPTGIAILTAGIDVQSDRLEMLVKGYGVKDEQWIVAYYVIHGDPTAEGVWRLLEEQLTRTYTLADGFRLRIEAAAVDSSYNTQRVYDFAARNWRMGRQWFAIKGVAGQGVVAWSRSKISLKGGAKLYLVGIDALKEEVYGRLTVEQPGPGYHHVPISDAFGQPFFEGLTAERVRTVYDTRGYPRREWFNPPGARNEPLDMSVYADAAHKSLNIDHAGRIANRSPKAKLEDVAAVAALFKR